jgi:hypothetical protein
MGVDSKVVREKRSRYRIMIFSSIFRIVGLLMLGFILLVIMWQYGLWGKMAAFDRIFFVVAILIISILLGVKREKILR